MTPGSVERYRIFLPNLAHGFRAGHRLRFTLTSSSKNVAFPNPNAGAHPFEDAKKLTVTQTVYHTDAYRSRLLLPVLTPR